MSLFFYLVMITNESIRRVNSYIAACNSLHLVVNKNHTLTTFLDEIRVGILVPFPRERDDGGRSLVIFSPAFKYLIQLFTRITSSYLPRTPF